MGWITVYSAAQSAGTFLALAGAVLFSFFGIAKVIVHALSVPIRRIIPEHAYKLLVLILTYGFVLACLTLIGAFGSYALQHVIKKWALEQQVRSHLINRLPLESEAVAKEIISNWPNDPRGYRFLAASAFQQKKYDFAAKNFEMAISTYSKNMTACELQAENHLVSDYIAATAASGKSREAYAEMKKIESCNLDKMDKLNFGKLSLVNRDFERSSGYLEPLHSDESRPDLRDKANILLSILYLLRDGQKDGFVKHFSRAVCLNPALRPLAFGILPGAMADMPGEMVLEYAEEISLIRLAQREDLVGDLHDTLKNKEACSTAR